MPSPLIDKQIQILTTCIGDLILAYGFSLPETDRTAVADRLETFREDLAIVQDELAIG